MKEEPVPYHRVLTIDDTSDSEEALRLFRKLEEEVDLKFYLVKMQHQHNSFDMPMFTSTAEGKWEGLKAIRQIVHILESPDLHTDLLRAVGAIPREAKKRGTRRAERYTSKSHSE